MDLIKIKSIKVKVEDLKTHILITNPNIENTNLGKDIKKNGIKEPILVEDLFNGKYQIVDGYHRYYIAKKLGIKELECIVVIIPVGYNWREQEPKK